jgi:hypothetical protein
LNKQIALTRLRDQIFVPAPASSDSSGCAKLRNKNRQRVNGGAPTEADAPSLFFK